MGLFGNSPEKLFEKGMLAYHDGKYDKAFPLIEKAAEKGHIKAQCRCGEMYAAGLGTKKNGSKAFYWYEKAERQLADERNADFLAGGHLEEVRKEIESLKQEVEEQRERLFQEAIEPYDAGNYIEALQKWEKAAEMGHVTAQYNCGILYDTEESIPRDPEKALYWYERAAEQGMAKAQFRCGKMYYMGNGTERNLEKAFQWELKAAGQGHADAQCACGCMFYHGQGTERDLVHSFNMHQKAAENGHNGSMLYCGEMCYNGEGTRQDLYKALEWFKMAAENGVEEAIPMIDKLKEEIPEQEKKKAKQRQLGSELYQQGMEALPEDEEEALVYFEKAANMGYIQAMLKCGEIYLNLYDPEQAEMWLDDAVGAEEDIGDNEEDLHAVNEAKKLLSELKYFY